MQPADVGQLLRDLPRLRRFVFDCEGDWAPVDDSLLQHIGKAAPFLEELSLEGQYPLQVLHTVDATQPLFPSLSNLSMSGISLVTERGVIAEGGDPQELIVE